MPVNPPSTKVDTNNFPHPYIESAKNGANNRNKLCRLEDFEPNGYADVYRSVLRYPGIMEAYMKGNGGSVEGYQGSTQADFFPADFDDKENPGNALRDARDTVRRWEAVYGVPPGALRYYYSGYKGFHIEIPAELFGGLEPGKDTAARMKAVAGELLKESTTPDRGIYYTTCLWRVPNTKNKKSGRYKIPLTANEFFNFDFDAIKEMATEKRTGAMFPDPGEFGVVDELRKLWLGSVEKASTFERAQPVDEVIPEEKRNVTLTSLAGSYRQRGHTEDEIFDFLSIVNKNRCVPPLDEREVRSIARSIGKKERGQMATPNLAISTNTTNTANGTNTANAANAVISAAELMEMEFAPTNWVVPDILPEGVTLLVGKPKKGKSWMALQMCEAVATGGVAFGTRRVEQGEALYLALEDNKKRLKKRLKKMLEGRSAPEGMYLHTQWPRLDEGGDEVLDAWLSEHPDTRLVVIDTLAKVRKPARGQNVYAEDYAALEQLRPLSEAHGVGFTVVHHLRKMAASDPLDEINSSTGLTAGVDGFMILRRVPGSKGPTLYVDGRDIEEPTEYALHWNINTATWTIEGEAEEVHLSKERQDILLVLNRSSEPLSPKDIAEALGPKTKAGNVRYLLWAMLQDEQVVKGSDGKYTPAHPTNAPNATNGEKGDTYA